MPKRYLGNIITDTPTDPTGDAAGGVWSLAEANAFKAGNAWPTLPDAPTIGTATDAGSGGAVNVAFTEPELYGGTISQYTATSTPDSITGTNTTSPITVSGLTNGTSYTFTVKATTGAGTGPDSSASNSVAPTLPAGKVLYMGGITTSTDYNNNVDTFDINTLGNATDFGDLTVARNGLSAVGSSTRAVAMAGETSGTSYSDVIDYRAFSTSGNFSDFGDLTGSEGPRRWGGGCSNETRGLLGGGQNPNRGDACNTIHYITIASTGDSTDFGDLTQGDASGRVERVAAAASTTNGIWLGGRNEGNSNVDDMQRVTIASTGNASFWGNLRSVKYWGAAAVEGTRLIYGGGNSGFVTNAIDFKTVTSSGNMSDFGDLLQANNMLSAASGGASRVVFAGGQLSSGTKLNVIQYITSTTTGNATDFGDLTYASNLSDAASNGHGGLS